VISIFDAFYDSRTFANSHLVSGHVATSTGFDAAEKSSFTNGTGQSLDSTAALLALNNLRGLVAGQMKSRFTSPKEINFGNVKVVRLKGSSTHAGKTSFAVSAGTQVGVGGTKYGGKVCKWVVFSYTDKKNGQNQHECVTAFPADDHYVTKHKDA
jgi:hypothetical protein